MPDGLNKKELAESYGYALAFMKSDPELWKLFNQAVKGDWDDARFEAKLKDSKWFKNHSATYRNNLLQMKTDPGTWEARLGEMHATLQDFVNQAGASLSGKALKKFSRDALLYGWSNEQIKNKVAGYVDTVAGGHYGGQAGEDEESLRKLAADFGQTVEQKNLHKWVVDIARGNSTVQEFEAYMRKTAESSFPGYRDQIRSGMTVREIADPYMQSMAEVLEINPSNIDVKDPTIRRALTHVQADTGKAGEFSLYDFEVELRKDPRWLRTKGAQDQAMAVTRKVMQDWGFQAS